MKPRAPGLIFSDTDADYMFGGYGEGTSDTPLSLCSKLNIDERDLDRCGDG